MRYLLLLLLSLSLFGRDNPFFPAEPDIEPTPTSNRVQKPQPFSTQKILLPNSARVLKAVVLRYQNLDGSIQEQTQELNMRIDWHEPFVLTHKSPLKSKTKKSTAKTIKTRFVTFVIDKKSLSVKTEDKLLQNFLLTNPHRVVLDFKRDTSFKPKLFTLNKPPFSKIRMGNHDGYYRVVIVLDGQYRYKLLTREKDYTIVLR